ENRDMPDGGNGEPPGGSELPPGCSVCPPGGRGAGISKSPEARGPGARPDGGKPVGGKYVGGGLVFLWQQLEQPDTPVSAASAKAAAAEMIGRMVHLMRGNAGHRHFTSCQKVNPAGARR